MRRLQDESISCCSLDGTRYDDLGWPYYEIIQIMAGQETNRESTIMRTLTLAAFLAATCVGMSVASAQQVPATPEDVAQLGGKIPGAPELALVKLAEGFHDPLGVTTANDASLSWSAQAASEWSKKTARCCLSRLSI